MSSPKNLRAPIGTPLRHVLEFCAIDAGAVKKLVAGGPLMGVAQPDRDAPVLKTTAGVSVINPPTEGTRRYCCINCGGCARACPVRLIPSLFAKYVGKNRLDDARCWGIEDCIECGACAFICPARINLVHYIKLGKALLERRSGPAKFARDAYDGTR
jgi:electron transport complex protein RnfC